MLIGYSFSVYCLYIFTAQNICNNCVGDVGQGMLHAREEKKRNLDFGGLNCGKGRA
jgi:hypothetical protein